MAASLNIVETRVGSVTVLELKGHLVADDADFHFIEYVNALVADGNHALALETWKRVIVFRESEVEALSRTIHYSAGASFACAAVRRDVWHRLGGCDAEPFPSQHNDSDFDLRALARGSRHLYIGSVEVFHEPGTSEMHDRTSLEPIRKLFANEPRARERRSRSRS